MRAFNLITLVFAYLTSSQSQQLIVEYSSAKLPHGQSDHRLYYDGLDSIYIFGGRVSPNNQILKYCLDSDMLLEIGSLPYGFISGSVQSDSAGNIILLGANEVWKYETSLNTSTFVATLPWHIFGMPTIKPCNLLQAQNTVFILGGYSGDLFNQILLFDLENYNFSESAETLPVELLEGSSICVNGRAFVFPAYNYANRSVWEFDVNSHLLSPVGLQNLPILNTSPSSVSVEGVIFIITGFNQSQIPPDFSNEGILRFDPATNSTDFVPLENWPVKDGESYFLTAPQCEYVHKFARIYCFGGYRANIDLSPSFSDEIFFIQMPSSTTATNPIESTTKAPNLMVQYLSTKLPNVEYCHRLHYDGDDSIYVFGGCLNTNQILKYSLESDIITQIGILTNNFARGSIHEDPEGNVLLFGAGFGRDVLKYYIGNDSTTIVTSLLWWVTNSPTVKGCSPSFENNIYIFGGAADVDNFKLQAFDARDYSVSEFESISPLPMNLLYGNAICVGGRIFVFPTSTRGNQSVWEFDLVSNELVSLGQHDLPIISVHPSLVSDGDTVFIIAGFNRKQAESHEGILHFEPATGSTKFLHVDNWPVKDGQTYFGTPPQCVFIQKNSRIYCFGGQSSKLDARLDRRHDEIFYIDMTSYLE